MRTSSLISLIFIAWVILWVTGNGSLFRALW